MNLICYEILTLSVRTC